MKRNPFVVESHACRSSAACRSVAGSGARDGSSQVAQLGDFVVGRDARARRAVPARLERRAAGLVADRLAVGVGAAIGRQRRAGEHPTRPADAALRRAPGHRPSAGSGHAADASSTAPRRRPRHVPGAEGGRSGCWGRCRGRGRPAPRTDARHRGAPPPRSSDQRSPTRSRALSRGVPRRVRRRWRGTGRYGCGHPGDGRPTARAPGRRCARRSWLSW